jgi:hypothetical protein
LKEKKFIPICLSDLNLLFITGIALAYYLHHAIRVHQVYPRYYLLGLPLLVIFGFCSLYRIVKIHLTPFVMKKCGSLLLPSLPGSSERKKIDS